MRNNHSGDDSGRHRNEDRNPDRSENRRDGGRRPESRKPDYPSGWQQGNRPGQKTGQSGFDRKKDERPSWKSDSEQRNSGKKYGSSGRDQGPGNYSQTGPRENDGEGNRNSSGFKPVRKSGNNPYDRRGKRPGSIKVNLERVCLPQAINDGETRLNKFIAHAGICSRREADELIKAGLVSVNDQVVTEMGVKVNPGDIVKYNGERLRSERKVYILLNKPRDFVTTADDPEGRKTVMDLVRNACPERVYPVGRLDRNTTGILLLTNDGALATRLTHPKFNVKKIYHVFLENDLKEEDLAKLAEGITLDDGFIKPDAVHYANPEKRNELGMEIHSGKNRIVRRMLEHLGYKVIRLDRVVFAGLNKKNLPRGRYRFLNEREINMLKMNVFE